MNAKAVNPLFGVLQTQDDSLLDAWMKAQTGSMASRKDLIKESELREQSRKFLAALRDRRRERRQHRYIRCGMGRGARFSQIHFGVARPAGFHADGNRDVRVLPQGTGVRAVTQGCRRQRQVARVGIVAGDDAVDRLGLYTTEVYQKTREEVIGRQQQEMLELSTPVVKLWDGILALPLIGTLDSARTQVVMESLLQRSSIRGRDRDHRHHRRADGGHAGRAALLKTVAAARLMGADCIISGIRPQIAQTIVHSASISATSITKATLADAFADRRCERTGDGDRRRRPRRLSGEACDGTHSDPEDGRLPARHHPGGHARPAGADAAGRSHRPRSSRHARKAC